MQHVMVDIETLGNKVHSPVIHLSAVQFDIKTGRTGYEFDYAIEMQSVLNYCKAQASTIKWWLEQDEAARKALLDKQYLAMQAPVVFTNFAAWFKDIDDGFEKGAIIWGNSARFDLGMIEYNLDKFNIETPWKFWNERCLKTLAALRPGLKFGTKQKGIAHNAIDDCKHQIAYAVKIMNAIS